jgi:hypothetical protein
MLMRYLFISGMDPYLNFKWGMSNDYTQPVASLSCLQDDASVSSSIWNAAALFQQLNSKNQAMPMECPCHDRHHHPVPQQWMPHL